MTSESSRGGASAATPESVFQKNADISLTRFGEEGLLVVPRQALQAVLNGTAARVLELVDGERDAAAIATAIADEYETGDENAVQADVLEILEDLEERGAITRS